MPYDIEESKAFVETVIIEPKSAGVLTGLRFAVKDLIDLGVKDFLRESHMA